MEVRATERGFERIDFWDCNYRACSLQQSSLALFDYSRDALLPPGSSALWLGVGDERMHLSTDHVEALIKHLMVWLDTGSLRITDEQEAFLAEHGATAWPTAKRGEERGS